MKLHLIKEEKDFEKTLCGVKDIYKMDNTLLENICFLEYDIFQGEYGKKLKDMYLSSPIICKNCLRIYQKQLKEKELGG